MAKDHSPGDEWNLYIDTASSWASPTWVQIKAYVDPTIDPEKTIIEVNEQNNDTGNMHGYGNPLINFTLLIDKGDSNVEALVAATLSGAMKHIAISRGPIATAANKYYHMEALLTAPTSASKGSVASMDIEARRHANSDNTLTRATVPS